MHARDQLHTHKSGIIKYHFRLITHRINTTHARSIQLAHTRALTPASQADGYYLDRVAHHLRKELGRVGDLRADAPNDAQPKRTVHAHVHVDVITIDALRLEGEQRIDERRSLGLCLDTNSKLI